MRILVCGGRDYYKYSVVKSTLENILSDIWHEDEDTEITIIQGGAAGADFLAKVFALDEMSWLKVPRVLHEEYRANWKKFGMSAGSIRNQQMLDEGKPDLVVAFPGGRGTKDMITRAESCGVKVLKIEEDR